MDRTVARELLKAKTPKVLKDLPVQDAGWRIRHAFFAHVGLTEAAKTEARLAGAQLVDLATLDADLRHTPTNP